MSTLRLSVAFIICAGLLFLARAQDPCTDCNFPHCCGMYCGGTCCLPKDLCFREGNCFGECTCGTSGCPSPGFWNLLYKNTTTSFFLSSSERGHVVDVASGNTRLTIEELRQLEHDAALIDPVERNRFIHRVILQEQRRAGKQTGLAKEKKTDEVHP